MLTKEEIDAIEECVNTREDEGFDVTVARAALEKLKKNSISKFVQFNGFEFVTQNLSL